MFDELCAVSGTRFVFEPFPAQLAEIHRKRNRPQSASSVKPFSPARLVNWLQDQANLYFEKTGRPRFKLHNFRGTAMSRARGCGVSYDDAAIAFGCHPETMRRHYVAEDELSVSDRVMNAI
jgi:hypothetical protein